MGAVEVFFQEIYKSITHLISIWGLDAGIWRFADHITVGEGRAVVRLVRLLASVKEAHGHRVGSLQDNSLVSGASSKGRSPSPALNYLARVKVASSLAADLQTLLPWVQTTRQTADAISRSVALQMRLQAARAAKARCTAEC